MKCKFLVAPAAIYCQVCGSGPLTVRSGGQVTRSWIGRAWDWFTGRPSDPARYEFTLHALVVACNNQGCVQYAVPVALDRVAQTVEAESDPAGRKVEVDRRPQ